MDTESETDQADVPMSSTASAVPTARWPPMDDASVADQQRRTARRQQRRAEEFATGERHLRNFRGNAGNRAHSRISDFPPVLTHDSRAPPTGSSSSRDLPPAPQRSLAPRPSTNRRAVSFTRAAEARNVRQRSDYSDADLPEHGTAGMERLARQSPQATYAAATLKGKTEIGVLSKPFIATIREDLKKYSIISENSFLVQFFKERETKDILYLPVKWKHTPLKK